MTEQVSHKPVSKLKFGLFVGFILFLILGFSGGWYWASGRLDREVTQFTENLARGGKRLECSNKQVRGYPFRLGLFCDTLSYADPVGGITVSGNALRSAAQIYRPGHVVAEADAPYDISLPGLVPLTLDWRNLKSSSKIGMSGFQRLSVVVDDMKVSANDFGDRDLLGSLSQMQLHARPGIENKANDLDIAFSGDDWIVDDNGANAIEPVTFDLQVNLDDGMKIIRERRDPFQVLRSNGGSGMLHKLMLRTQSGGRILVSGPAEISPSGLLSGDFTLELDDPQKLVSYGQSVFPPLGNMLSQWTQYLDAFAQQADGKIKIRNLKISVKNGKILMGFFEIGEIPRLF